MKSRPKSPSHDAVHRFPAVSARVAIPRSSLYKLIAKGEFPQPVLIGGRRVGWLESDIEAWLAERPHVSRKGTAK